MTLMNLVLISWISLDCFSCLKKKPTRSNLIRKYTFLGTYFLCYFEEESL